MCGRNNIAVQAQLTRGPDVRLTRKHGDHYSDTGGFSGDSNNEYDNNRNSTNKNNRENQKQHTKLSSRNERELRVRSNTHTHMASITG